jgi:DNA-binding transcriptional MerR regulator
MVEGKLRIGYVAKLLGVTPHYLRMLEWEGRIPAVNYDRLGRLYTESDIKLLRAMGVGTHPQKLRRVEDVLGAAQ